MGDGTIRVYLLDDHDVVRQAEVLLEQQGDIQVVGESPSAVEATARISALRPDVAVLDARLPRASRSSGYVLKEIRSSDLLSAVSLVAQGMSQGMSLIDPAMPPRSSNASAAQPRRLQSSRP